MALPLLALGVACASSSDAPVARLDTLADGTIARSHRGLVSDTLVGSVIAAGDGVGDPRGLALVGSHLWIADRAGDPYLHVVDLTGTSSAVPRGARGEGPGDYRATTPNCRSCRSGRTTPPRSGPMTPRCTA